MTVYRNIRFAFGKNGEHARNPFGGYLRYGRKGILDVIHHEGGHMNQHLMFSQKSNGSYRDRYNPYKETNANRYMKLLRGYD